VKNEKAWHIGHKCVIFPGLIWLRGERARWIKRRGRYAAEERLDAPPEVEGVVDLLHRLWHREFNAPIRVS
jgi:hypothetical protein